ncbi:MAG: LPS assembly lipoprotein LptE [Chitinophagales bacterium]
MLATRKISFIILLLLPAFINNSCHVRYGFRDVSIPPEITTVKVNLIENRAGYVNVQLSPQLTDKLRQKIVSQTRLKQTNGDDADWDITGTITEYSFSTAGISNQQTTTNRINVSVRIVRNDQKQGKTKEYIVSRNFDFPSSQTLQQAETSLLSDMIRGLADDIFNQLFSDW